MSEAFAGKIFPAESNRSFVLETAKNHRIREWLRLGGIFGDHVPAQSRVTYRMLSRTMSHWAFNICIDGNTRTPHSTTLTVRKLVFMFKWNFLYFSWCPLPPVLSLGTTEKTLDLLAVLCLKHSRDHDLLCPRWHSAGSCSTCCPPGPPGLSVQNCSPAG